MSSVTLEPQTSIDQTSFLSWLETARSGEEIAYHRGMLARDASVDHAIRAMRRMDRDIASQIAMRAVAIRHATQYSAGLETGAINIVSPQHSTYFDARLPRRVDLLQRKLGECDYLYVARRR